METPEMMMSVHVLYGLVSYLMLYYVSSDRVPLEAAQTPSEPEAFLSASEGSLKCRIVDTWHACGRQGRKLTCIAYFMGQEHVT